MLEVTSDEIGSINRNPLPLVILVFGELLPTSTNRVIIFIYFTVNSKKNISGLSCKIFGMTYCSFLRQTFVVLSGSAMSNRNSALVAFRFAHVSSGCDTSWF